MSASDPMATFEARSRTWGDGAVVLWCSPRPAQLFVARQLWGGEGSASLAHLAPLSAVIRRQRGG